ncbi:MAG: hypothetical protein PUD93_06220 [Lachnospiraceae bacterium]|nr:hypothetical protein [Lachnospiraceae bacterium]
MENLRTTWNEVKETTTTFFKREFVTTGKECFLAGICLVLFGTVIGLVCAPLTRGINITLWSHNGNNNGNNQNGSTSDKQEDAEEISKHHKKVKVNRQ